MLLAFSPFYFQVFGASLLSLLWILFKEITYFLFIYLVLWVSTLPFHLCCISLSFHHLFFFFFLTCSTWGLLSSGFMVVFFFSFWFLSLEGKFFWVVCVDFFLGMTCDCVLVGGDQVGNYRNKETCTHTSTQSYNQSV